MERRRVGAVARARCRTCLGQGVCDTSTTCTMLEATARAVGARAWRQGANGAARAVSNFCVGPVARHRYRYSATPRLVCSTQPDAGLSAHVRGMASSTRHDVEDGEKHNPCAALPLPTDPMSSLAAAINGGSVYSALAHLSALDAVPSGRAASSVPHEKLLNLYRCVLPMLLLPRALARYDASLRRDFLPLISIVYANVHGVRNALPFAEAAHLRDRVSNALKRLSQAQIDDASAALAQAAATISEQLCDAWSTMMCPSANLSPADLARDIVARTSRMRSYTDEAHRLDLQIMNAHRAAVSVHQTAARIAHEAVQIDVSARQRSGSYDECRAQELLTRGEALRSKLRMLRAQMLSQMYTAESVRALQMIAKEVSDKEEQVERELQVEGGRLAEYRSLGADFEKIVAEILHTQQVLEQKEWSRKELSLC